MSRILFRQLMKEGEPGSKYPDNSLYDLNAVEQELGRYTKCPPIQQYIAGNINSSQLFNSEVKITDVGELDHLKHLIGKKVRMYDLTVGKSSILKGSKYAAKRLWFDENDYTIPPA